ncbi:MAG TPA: T9SS type A sorting domain-containing protein, partial [Bacteroidia bacterium]|nr:T9SS type A sorting domain-containing protein [Bacteroidia bacterium]
PASAMDSLVELTDDGVTAYGVDQHNTALWNTVLTNSSYGHNMPLWGTTWTPTDINTTLFGVFLKVQNISPIPTSAAVDHIQVTICYSDGTGIHSATSSPSAVQWMSDGELFKATIRFDEISNCSAAVYSPDGKLISSEQFGTIAPGEKEFEFHSSQLPGGMYIWRISVGDKIYTEKIIVANN